jgi:uncharacterized protein YciI
MAQFLLRLIPIRPTFAFDMSEAEKETMQRHAAYCEELIDRGVGFLFGPVLDPKRVWGLGIIEAADEAEARALGEKDPAVIAGLGHYEVAPMRVSFLRKG